MNARALAAVALVVLGFGAVYTIAVALGAPDPSWAYLSRTVVHLAELAAVLAVGWSGATGGSALGRIGVIVAVAGSAVLAVAEALVTAATALSDTLFAIAPIVVGVGLVLAGIAIVQAGVWSGWARFVVLVLGGYVLLVLIPVIVVGGPPPQPSAIWALVGWALLWIAIATAVLRNERVPVRAATPG